jgi:hypothetical protein
MWNAGLQFISLSRVRFRTSCFRHLNRAIHRGKLIWHYVTILGVNLDVIEPMLLHDPRVLIPLISSLRMAGVHSHVNLVGGFSPEEVIKYAQSPQTSSYVRTQS